MNSTMFNAGDILETIRMIQDECLDIRTTTMGISLLDCIDPDINKACDKVSTWMRFVSWVTLFWNLQS